MKDGQYDNDRQRPFVLVCDTGHMSRVAADIMIKDEGFANVYNLRGGMSGWRRSIDRRAHLLVPALLPLSRIRPWITTRSRDLNAPVAGLAHPALVADRL